jgi:hypothetical protein
MFPPPFFDKDVLLSIWFSITLCLPSFLRVRDQVLYPHKTAGKIAFFVYLNLKLFSKIWKDINVQKYERCCDKSYVDAKAFGYL